MAEEDEAEEKREPGSTEPSEPLESAEPSEPETGLFERRVRALASVVAPTTALGALLFYFGYVSSRAEYEYFGIDVDAIGLGTQDYIMRSPQPLLVPLLVLTLIGIAALLLHAWTLRRIERAKAASNAGPREGERLAHMARRNRDVGLGLLAIGVAMLFVYAVVGGWSLYPLVTPLLIAVGGVLAAYYAHVLELVSRAGSRASGGSGGSGGSSASGGSGGSDRSSASGASGASRPSGSYAVPLRAATVLLYVVIAASVFWATATVAQWTGRGLARHQAHDLEGLPTVILDTKERLFLHSPGIEETILPESAGQTFHYRYRNLRLLIEGHDRLFLVPATWSASDSTTVVPFDSSARVQFQFVNERP